MEYSVPDWRQYRDAPRSALRAILSFDQTSWLPDNLLERGDRMTMATSLEARMPFMDHKLANFSASLPVRMKVRGRKLRYIQYQLASRYLPALADARLLDSNWEIRTLLPSSEIDDSRPILFQQDVGGIPNLVCVLGGKIDNVYDLREELINYL